MKRKLHPAAPTAGGGGSPLQGQPSAKHPPGTLRPPTLSHGRSKLSWDLPGGSFAVHLGWGGLATLTCVFGWSYWPTILSLWQVWQTNQDYSGGKVVPLIAGYLIWSNRKELSTVHVGTCWLGLLTLLLAQALRFFGILYAYRSLEHASLYLSFLAIVLLVFGRGVFWRLRWILAFAALTFPLPGEIHASLALPLQNFATSSALFGLELLGVLVAREGNVLKLNEQTTIAVAEACSGLRMLTAFVVVAATLAFVVRRPAWQKILLVLSSIPVAILCNTLRLITTALLYQVTSSETAEAFFHDFAGITMMPIAVLASVALLALMKWLSGDGASRTAS